MISMFSWSLRYLPEPVVYWLRLIKDVGGAGALVFKGMHRILQESRPVLLVEFYREDEWNGREELLDARYDLHDIKGWKLDPTIHVQRVYHCLACPSEGGYNAFGKQPSGEGAIA